MASVTTRELVRDLRPSLVLTDDTAYTPRSEILDVCGQLGIPVIRWYSAHQTNVLILKRYTLANRDHDINSLSDASWRVVREMNWNANRSEGLNNRGIKRRLYPQGLVQPGWSAVQ